VVSKTAKSPGEREAKHLTLLLSCATAAFVIAVALPNFTKAGGLEITPGLLLLTIACTVVTVGGFLWCPWRNYVAKLLTVVFMLAALKFSMDVAIIIVGRWLDPGFAHC